MSHFGHHDEFPRDARVEEAEAIIHQDAMSFDPDNPKQVLALTGKIFVRHIPQCVVWAVCYLVVINAFGLSSNLLSVSFNGEDSGWIYYGTYILIPPLLLLLFGWLRRLTLGKWAGGLKAEGPFRWMKVRSFKHFLFLCLGVAAAYICRDVILEGLAAAVGPFIFPRQLGNSFSMIDLLTLYTGYSFREMQAYFPMLFLPALLMLQWFADYLCIRAARTKGEGDIGGLDTRGLVKRMLRVELRLMPVWLLAPLTLYWAASNYAGAFMNSIQAEFVITSTAALSIILCVVYCARSAMARTLLVNAFKKAEWVPAPPMDFAKIDDGFAKETEEKCREGEEPLKPE